MVSKCLMKKVFEVFDVFKVFDEKKVFEMC